MKKKRLVCCLMLLLLALFGCSAENPEDDWGSFTAEQTNSYDGRYYADQTVVEREGIRFVQVSVPDKQNRVFKEENRKFWLFTALFCFFLLHYTEEHGIINC